MKPDKRVERNTQSVIALRDLLREIVQSPPRFSEDVTLIEALKSQGSLSRLSVGPRGIASSSLNTVKRIAEHALDGGFNALDRLRLAAQAAIALENTTWKRSNKADKAGLTKRVNELAADNQRLRQDLLRLTHAFEKSLNQGRHYAVKADKPGILALCEREQRELRDMFSLRQHSLQTNPARGGNA